MLLEYISSSFYTNSSGRIDGSDLLALTADQNDDLVTTPNPTDLSTASADQNDDPVTTPNPTDLPATHRVAPDAFAVRSRYDVSLPGFRRSFRRQIATPRMQTG